MLTSNSKILDKSNLTGNDGYHGNRAYRWQRYGTAPGKEYIFDDKDLDK
jgi:hypothetical protein